MKTDTANKILDFIEQKKQATPKQLVDFLGFTPAAIFRQLKKLLNQGRIVKSGKPPRVWYHLPMTEKEFLSSEALKWAVETNPKEINPDFFCLTRDVFQARLDRLTHDLVRFTNNETLSYFLSAICGEIGNNSFDHNLGNWPDIHGVYFKADMKNKIIALADRGQGVLATLKKIKPEITNDAEALKTAFTEIISGRAPEQRGNGLKFVKKEIQNNNLTLRFYSGRAICYIDSARMEISESNASVRGVAALIEF